MNYPGDVWLYDLGSTVGTRIGGETVNGRRFLDGVHEVVVGQTAVKIAARPGVLV